MSFYYQAQVIRLVHYGFSDADIAKHLDISLTEVRNMVSRIQPPPVITKDSDGKVLQSREYLED